MNEEEVQIDLMTLLHYILRKWRRTMSVQSINFILLLRLQLY